MSRPKGTPNRATANAREAIGRFVDSNATKVQGWMDEVYERDGPLAAIRCYMDFVEYHVPKLARTEHVGDGGAPIQVVINKLAG